MYYPKHNAMLRYELGAASDTDQKKLTVERVANHVYFYAHVDSDRCLDLLTRIRELDTELRAEQISRGLEDAPMTPIWLHIHSYGGDLFSGFSTSDQLKRIKSPVYAVVEGIAASAATLIAMSATKRYILPNSFMMIHQLSALMWGTHEQFKDEMELQKKAMDKLIAFYAQRSKLNETELRDLLKRDFWLDAEAAVENGFVDEIIA
jgi:ATP-dependent Clp protease, protease subunit